jgi:hypothetical protein
MNQVVYSYRTGYPLVPAHLAMDEDIPQNFVFKNKHKEASDTNIDLFYGSSL